MGRGGGEGRKRETEREREEVRERERDSGRKRGREGETDRQRERAIESFSCAADGGGLSTGPEVRTTVLDARLCCFNSSHGIANQG